MNTICLGADNMGLTLHLKPSPIKEKTISLEKLINFYERFGFSGKREYFIRRPKLARPKLHIQNRHENPRQNPNPSPPNRPPHNPPSPNNLLPKPPPPPNHPQPNQPSPLPTLQRPPPLPPSALRLRKTQGFRRPIENLATVAHEIIHIASAVHEGYYIDGTYYEPYLKQGRPALNNEQVRPYLQDHERGIITNLYANNTPKTNLGNIVDEINAATLMSCPTFANMSPRATEADQKPHRCCR